MTDTMDTTTRTRRRRAGAVVALLAAGALAGGITAATLSASASDTTPSATPSNDASDVANPWIHGPDAADKWRHGSDAGRGWGMPMRSDETQLSGSDASAAKKAALAAVPGGTTYRMETDAGDGVYEVHMTKADGTPVTVKLDRSFGLIRVEAGMGHGDPGLR